MEGRSRRKPSGVSRLWIVLCGLAAVAAVVFAVWQAAEGAISNSSEKDGREMASLRPSDGEAGNSKLAGDGRGELTGDGTGADSGSVSIFIRNESPAQGSELEAEPASGESAEVGKPEETGDSTDGDLDYPISDDSGGSITLAFAGDVLLSDHVLNAYRSGGGIGGVVGGSLLQAANAADLFMVNQEFPFSNRGSAAPDKQFTFRLPPEKVSMLQEMGIDLVTLANNHALDFGTDALLDTCRTLEEAGIPYVGAGENLERAKALYSQTIGGWTVGFLGATRVMPTADWAATRSGPGMLSTYDPGILLEEIRKAKETCDYLVVYVHWGVEREERPKDYQRQLGHQYIDAGADLVIGSHPHVLQGIEYYQGKPIIYSLGNFVFGSSIPRTVLLKASWDGETTRLSVIPAVSSAGYTREVTEEKKVQELFSYLQSISFDIQIDELGNILSGEP
ncbi:MAG: CapA family protein [Lachnospiraceae bacterium]|nr:CapA family protein [Lachnospiraceae bacterium]